MVVNTWRDTPLDERSESDFPDQMTPYSVSRNHCLVTGLQLFVLRAQIESGALRSDDAKRQLLGTVGVLEGFTDWRSVLHEIKSSS